MVSAIRVMAWVTQVSVNNDAGPQGIIELVALLAEMSLRRVVPVVEIKEQATEATKQAAEPSILPIPALEVTLPPAKEIAEGAAVWPIRYASFRDCGISCVLTR